MDKANRQVQEATRRRFLAACGAAALSTGLTARPASARQAGPFVRRSLSDPLIGPILSSYQAGIAAMLALPPTDPRNWYRIAFIHELDCPHANWWLLPWHRGYIGYLECIIRDLSGDPTFALPYWDWTANPSLPVQFANIGTVLNPANPAYIASRAAFNATFAGPVTAMYASFSPTQLSLLNKRRLPNAPSFTRQIMSDFFPGLASRNLNFGARFQNAVSLNMITSALSPTVFGATGNPVNFGSDPAPDHEQHPGEGTLESQPHDETHIAVGGLMARFLSPADPIFWMHHSNIDRLWDVWTRKQLAAGGAILPPPGPDLTTWQAEPFLFFVDCLGNPATKTTAGDYASTALFNYVYTPGSGEGVIPAGPAPAALHPQVASALSRNLLDFAQPTTASASVPAAALQKVGVPKRPGNSSPRSRSNCRLTPPVCCSSMCS